MRTDTEALLQRAARHAEWAQQALATAAHELLEAEQDEGVPSAMTDRVSRAADECGYFAAVLPTFTEAVPA